MTSYNSSCTLWMGDIENWMDEGYLISVYKELGLDFDNLGVSISSVKVIRDKGSKSKMGKNLSK